MKAKLIAVILAIAMLTMLAIPAAKAWNYGDPAIATDQKEEWFGPRADRILIPLYADQIGEWEAGLELGKIDVTDWPLDGTHYTRYSTLPWNTTITTISFGPQFGMRLFDLNVNNNTNLGNPPNPAYPQPTDVWLAGAGNPMAELSLRQALAYLTDRGAYAANCGPATTVPCYTLLGANSLNMTPWGKYTDEDITPAGALSSLCYLYNVTTASAVLNASGVFPFGGDGWRTYKGVPLSLLFYVRSDDPCRLYAGDLLTAAVQGPGIKIHVNEQRVNSASCTLAVMVNKDFHLYTAGWSLSVAPTFLMLWDWSRYYHPGQPQHYAGINDPIVNQAAENCYNANTQADAVSWAYQFQIEMATKAWNIPVWIAAGQRADSRTYTGGNNGAIIPGDPDHENNYRGAFWVGYVNEPGYGTDNYFSFLDMHPTGYDWGNGNMTIRYGFKVNNLQRLNPIYTNWVWDSTVIDTVGYDSLVTRDPLNLGQFAPFACSNFTVSTYNSFQYGTCTKVIYTLRDDIFFQDGVPETAADCFYTFVEIKNDLANRGLAPPWWIDSVSGILSFTILDPYNFEVLYNAKSIFAVTFAGGMRIMPEHIWKPITTVGDPAQTCPDPNLIGSGAWRLVEYVLGSDVLLVANTPGSVTQTSGDSQFNPGDTGTNHAVPYQWASVPVNSTQGYFKLLPVETKLAVQSIVPLTANATTYQNTIAAWGGFYPGMVKLPPEVYPCLVTLEDFVYNMFADRGITVYPSLAINGVPVTGLGSFYIPPGGPLYPAYPANVIGFNLEGVFDDVGPGVSYWTYNGTHLEYEKYLWVEPLEFHEHGNPVNSFNITLGSLTNVVASLTLGGEYWIHWDYEIYVPGMYPHIWQNRPFHYDLEWWHTTYVFDIGANNWYDDMLNALSASGVPTLRFPNPFASHIYGNYAAYKGELSTSDGVIDGSDLVLCASAFGSYPGHPRWNTAADVDHNYVVDGSDLTLVAAFIGKGELPD